MRVTTWSAPVRYAEVDQQGVVFNAHYLTYCDEAMSAHLSAVGHSYQSLIERGLDVQLVTSTLTWKSGARWPETVSVDVAVLSVGTSSMRWIFEIRAGERPCCKVETTYVMVAADGMQPTPVPEWLRAAFA